MIHLGGVWPMAEGATRLGAGFCTTVK
jgi:hypothetical protein